MSEVGTVDSPKPVNKGKPFKFRPSTGVRVVPKPTVGKPKYTTPQPQIEISSPFGYITKVTEKEAEILLRLGWRLI